MSYTKNAEGQTTRFVTQAQAVPVPWRLVMLGTVPVAFFLFISVTAALVTAVIMSAVIWTRMKIFPASRQYRSASTFSVSADQVNIDGKSIPRKDIHRAVIRNHLLSANNPSQFITLHQGLGALTGAASAAANASFNKQLANISYRVDVEAGGVAHTLASGLNESTAFAVLTDVSNILALQAA